MAKLSIVAGATSQSVNVFVQNSSLATGAGLTGFAPAGGSLLSGMTCYYSFSGANAGSVVQSLSVPATVGASFSAGQIVEIDATHMPGVARFDLPNGALATGKGRSVTVVISGGTNVAPVVLEIELTVVDNQSTGFGLIDVSANVVQWNGTNVASPATAGIPDVNAKNINNVSTSPVTTINANLGEIQPINFTGTGGSALVKSDATDIGGTAAASATIGTVTNLTNAGPDTSGTTTLLSRLTSARAGYLDNLNVGGLVASHADIAAINQSASKHLLLVTVGQYEPGETYTVEMRTFAAADGSAVNADTTPTLTATGNVSGNLSGNLSSATNPATGVYRWTYTPGSSPTLEQIRFDGSATINTSPFTLSCYSQTVDFATAVFTSTDQAHLTAIYNKLPTNNIADETLVLAATSAILSAVGSPMQAGNVTVGGYAANQDPWSIWKAATPSPSAAVGTNEWRVQLIDADLYTTDSGNPWTVSYMARGSGAPGVGTLLLSKGVYDTAGNPLTSTTVVVGGQH